MVTEEEKALWGGGQRLEWCSHKPRNTRSHQKLEEARENLQRECSPATPLIVDFWSLELEKMNLCCFKPPSLS